jgi:hypothetical protein
VVTRQERINDFDHEGTPPADRPLQILCEDHAGTYVVPFLCRWQDGAWRNVITNRRGYSDRLARAKAKSALNPEVLCRRLTSIRGFLVFDGLTLIERAKACPFDCRNMNEHIFAATLRLNESITLGRIEPFDGTDRH